MQSTLEATSSRVGDGGALREEALTVAIVLDGGAGDSRSGGVAEWALDVAAAHLDASSRPCRAALLDLADAESPGICECDAFVFVTPERAASWPAVLKSAGVNLAEWEDKSAGLLGYGPADAVPAIARLRERLAALRLANVRTAVWLSLADDFGGETLAPRPWQREDLQRMLDQVVAMSRALSILRGS